MSHRPTINTPPQGCTIAVVGDVYRFLATGQDTNGKYTLFEAVVGPGGGPPPHIHSREEEGFYVLDGEITFTVNGERAAARAGTFADMPLAEGATSALPPTKGEIEKLLATAPRYGIEIRLPPA